MATAPEPSAENESTLRRALDKLADPVFRAKLEARIEANNVDTTSPLIKSTEELLEPHPPAD